MIALDWVAEGVVSLAGHYRVTDMGVDLPQLFAAGKTLVIADTQDPDAGRGADRDATANLGMGVSSFINVPFHAGERVVGALAVAMASGPRSWTEDEITLAETVAGYLRSALEASRLHQRERNITQQLQEALQPTAPQRVQGLALKGFYRAALEEAGVGGDFWDVYDVEDGCTALVVADLSGKGLAAARQVATVRNMLRYALYSDRTVAKAVTHLKQVLTRQDLLTGFATLFVSVYDQRERSLVYVNCGQEPALIWRAATGQTDLLPPTGPVLGGFGDGSFTEEKVLFAPGDVFAVFTDGLSEAGPNRKQMLELPGVVRLFSGHAAREHARRSPAGGGRDEDEAVADRTLQAFMESVDAFGVGGRQDDISLLVGVVGNEVEGSA